MCVLVEPCYTIADLKVYLHEKNGTRMPLECIDIGVRHPATTSRSSTTRLTLGEVYRRTLDPRSDYTSGAGTLEEYERKASASQLAEHEANEREQLEQRAEIEIKQHARRHARP